MMEKEKKKNKNKNALKTAKRLLKYVTGTYKIQFVIVCISISYKCFSWSIRCSIYKDLNR